MKIAIMQPYFFPYIGYFQLIEAADAFVIYDDIEYTKKGWINRNRILKNGKDELISLPLKKDSDFLPVNKRFLSDDWSRDKMKLLNTIKEAYRKAPFYEVTISLVENCLDTPSTNLFDFILVSLKNTCAHLMISTPIIVSSSIDYDNTLKSTGKVLAICKKMEADYYLNPIGGMELYGKEFFRTAGVELQFLKTQNIAYAQFGNEHIPFLSMIDVLMFNSVDKVKMMLQTQYDIL